MSSMGLQASMPMDTMLAAVLQLARLKRQNRTLNLHGFCATEKSMY